MTALTTIFGVLPMALAAGRAAALIWPALLVLALLTGLFYVVPNTGVRFGDAIVGALLASVALELGKRGFAAYLVKLPSYRALYGSFAVLPLFMLWVYFSWLVTLIAALIAANLGRTRRPPPRRI